MSIILSDIKDSVGILSGNIGFDTELLLFINSVKTNLVQFGVTEMDIPISETTEWPTFSSTKVQDLCKHYILLKVKRHFDPTTSDTIARAMDGTVVELEGRITYQVEEDALP